MDPVSEALTRAAVSVIDTAGEQANLLVVLAFAGLAAWVKARWSAPDQKDAAFEAVLEVERMDQAEQAEGRKIPSGAKKRLAVQKAAGRLPARHRTFLPGALGRMVEAALPEARRASSPPLATATPEPSNGRSRP